MCPQFGDARVAVLAAARVPHEMTMASRAVSKDVSEYAAVGYRVSSWIQAGPWK